MGLLETLAGKAAAGLLAAGGIGLLIKIGRPILQRRIAEGLAKTLSQNIQNPKEKELVADLARAFIRFAEYKLPDRGGDAKKALAIKLLSPYLPGVGASAIGR